MIIKRNSMEIILTKEELYQAYQEQQLLFKAEDAREYFWEWLQAKFGRNCTDDEDIDELDEHFRAKYIFSCCDILDEDTVHPLLQKIISKYEHINTCAVAENALWREAIDKVMAEELGGGYA